VNDQRACRARSRKQLGDVGDKPLRLVQRHRQLEDVPHDVDHDQRLHHRRSISRRQTRLVRPAVAKIKAVKAPKSV